MNVPLARAGAPAYLWGALGLSTVVAGLAAFVPDPNGEAGGWRFFPLALTVGVLALMFQMPRKLAYALQPDALVVTYTTGEMRLPFRGMTAWRTAGSLGLKWGGTGLPGYYTGNYLFHADGLKNVLAASSDTKNGVIVQVSGKTYFLTPADPHWFLRELAARGATVKA